MPQPISTNAIIRPELAQVAMEYLLGNSNRGYIGTQVLPIFNSMLKNGQYPVIPIEALLTLPDTRRAPRAAYKSSDWSYDYKDFACSENGWEEFVDDSEAALLRSYFDAEVVATIMAMEIIERVQEKRIADLVYNESNFTPHAVTHGWLAPSAATPLKDVNAGKAAIEDATGLTPNALILNRELFRGLGLCDDVVDRIKYTNPDVRRGEIPGALLSAYFGVDYLLVAGGVYNSSNKGKAATIAKMWSSTYAMLGVISSGGDNMREPSLGRTILWTEDSESNVVVESYREEGRRSTAIRARQNTHEVLQFTKAGYLLKNVNATT